MRKRGAKIKHTTRSHVVTPKQVMQLLMPVHTAISLLPLGFFTKEHGDDLAAFINIAMCAAEEAGDERIKAATQRAAAAIIAIRERADTGAEWAATDAERSALMASAVAVDQWFRGLTAARILRACRKVDAVVRAKEKAKCTA